jgi:hypothetical protein
VRARATGPIAATVATVAVAAAAATAALALGLAACGKRKPEEAPPAKAEPAPAPTAPGDGGPPAPDDALAGTPAGVWPELEGMPLTAPERVVLLPTKPDVPRFSVGGPVIAGDLAVVSSSQFGFVAVDWRRGAIAWTKPAGLYVAPPLLLPQGAGLALIGDCFAPPQIPDGEHLLGCLRVVTPAGVDQAYMAIRGKPAAVEPFAAERGTQAVWRDGDRALRWRRGEQAVTVDLMTGVAAPAASLEPPPITVEYRAKRWEIEHADGKIVARTRRGARPAWSTENSYTALLGAVWQQDSAPMIRLADLSNRGGAPHVRVIDMDATGSLRTASARSMPGIALLASATSPVGDVALAVRLDKSLRRDFIAGYAVSAAVRWVYPLPEQPRVDPVGLAVAAGTTGNDAAGAVVVFHDGDTLTILPELSAPPTAPGASAGSSRNPTP